MTDERVNYQTVLVREGKAWRQTIKGKALTAPQYSCRYNGKTWLELTSDHPAFEAWERSCKCTPSQIALNHASVCTHRPGLNEYVRCEACGGSGVHMPMLGVRWDARKCDACNGHGGEYERKEE